MRPQQRLVTALPLESLWTDAGPLMAKRQRHLTPEEFDTIIPKQFIPIVVAECNKPLRWVDWSEYFTFCSQDAKRHIATPEAFSPGHFPDGYCYVASEWSSEDGRSLILLEMHRHTEAGESEPSTTPPTSSQLSALDREFYLGLYRYAVRRYQPVIEKRTGTDLGRIAVKDIAEFRTDRLAYLERYINRGWNGFLRRLGLGWRVESCRAWAEHSASRIAPEIGAVYAHNSFYVSFTLGTMFHEDAVARTTVHELAHCLWERLGGRFLDSPQLVIEGYAVYAERVWFRDSYPVWLRNRLASERLDETNSYTKGMRAIEKLVDKWGEWILLKVPRDWQKLWKTIDTDEH